MKLEITTSAKNVEMANFLLSEAIDAAKYNSQFLEGHNLTIKDLEKAEKFRKALLRSFLK